MAVTEQTSEHSHPAQPGADATPAPMMRVLVCGSRTWTDEAKVDEILRRVTAGASNVALVQGETGGANRVAALIAAQRGWTVEHMSASRPDFVVAFLDERNRPSPDTREMVRRAQRAGLHGVIVRAQS